MRNMDEKKNAKRTRRRFPEEFKTGAVRLVLDESRTVGSVARELDLTASALAQWVRREEAERSKGRTGLTREEREELSRLRKENRELRMEREVLKNSRARRRLLLDQKLRFGYFRHRPRAVTVRLLVPVSP